MAAKVTTLQKKAKPVPIVLSLPFVDVVQLKKFVDLVDGYAAKDKNKTNGGFVKLALDGKLAEAPNALRFCRVTVGSEPIADGAYDTMLIRFNQEVGSHSGNVYLQELKGGKWETIKLRTPQR